MKVLISGGAGFIGSYLTEFFHNSGAQVFIIDKLSKQVHGDNYDNSYLYGKIKGKAVLYIEDIAESTSLDYLIEECDYFIHLAAETGTGQSMYEISNYVRSNSYATAIVLEKLVKRKHSIKKFILASSRAVYGEGKYYCEKHEIVYPETRKAADLDAGDFECKCPICGITVKELSTSEDSKLNPLSIYGITKFNQEQLVSTTCSSINIPYTIFRFQNVYGKGQSLNNPYTGILAIFSKLIMERKEINVFEDGCESRDFIHVNDIVNAIYLDMQNVSENQIYNVGTGIHTSVNQVIEILRRNFDIDVKSKISGSFRLGDIRHNYADISKISSSLNIYPEVLLEDGIQDLLQWVKVSQGTFTAKSFSESIDEMERLKLLVKKL